MKKLSTPKIIILACSVLAIIAWCLVIFRLSATSSQDSNDGSISLTKKLISKVISLTDDVNHTNSHIDESELDKIAVIINRPLRKVAHATVYFILALILLIISRIAFGDRKYLFACIITLLFCFAFALTDEYHQTFVDGRTGQFSDVLVDAAGASMGIILFSSYYFVWRCGNHKTNKQLKDVNCNN